MIPLGASLLHSQLKLPVHSTLNRAKPSLSPCVRELSPSNNQFLVSDDCPLCWMETETELRTVVDHVFTGVIDGAIHLPGGQRMMTCSEDGSLRVWNLKSGKQIGEDWRDGESEVWTIALSPDGKKVVSGSEDGAVRLWDIETGKVIEKWMGHTEGVRPVCWSRDGRRVLSGSYDGTARQWRVENEETILAQIETGHEVVYASVYSPDMTMFATGGWDGTPGNNYECAVKIWDSKTGELVATLKGHTDWVMCLVWTPDGKTLISGSFDNSIRKWNTSTWKQTALLEGHTGSVWAIAISPNGRILASASWDRTVRLWNLDNSQPISSPLQHAQVSACLSFSSDGKVLATGCDDYNAYTWDVYAILRDAGLEDLLLDANGDKAVLDATQRPVRQQPIKVSRRVPQGFFDEQPHRAHTSARPNAHNTSSRLRLFHWARNLFSGRQSGSHIEPAVDVPYAKGKRRNASAREKRKPIPKRKPASSSRPPNSNATQQSSGTTHLHSQPLAQAAVSTSSATPPLVATSAATTSGTNPHVTIKHAGRWARFWLFLCCSSAEYTDGHH